MPFQVEKLEKTERILNLHTRFSGDLSESGVPQWNNYPVSVKEFFPYRSVIEACYQSISSFSIEPHDQPHIFRGQILGLQQCRHYQKLGYTVNEPVLLWSFAFHDVGSNHDEDHGDRGADLIAPFVTSWFPETMSKQILDNVRWHNKAPIDVPDSVWTLEHIIMRVADTLELLRIHDGRTIYLLTEEAQRLIPLAENLINRTTNLSGGNMFDTIMTAAREIGLVAKQELL
jgi:hypothetical protein